MQFCSELFRLGDIREERKIEEFMAKSIKTEIYNLDPKIS